MGALASGLSGTWLTPDHDGPLLVVGPSLGTSAAQLWGTCASELAPAYSLLAWDLPGHAGTPVGDPFQLTDLAVAVLDLVDREAPRGTPFAYAGDSVGGAVGLALLLAAPDRVTAAVLISTGARIGEPSGWLERADTVRSEGMAVLVTGSLARWFSAPVTTDRPDLVAAFAETLRAVDAEGYALVCEALARFDVRAQLAEIRAPVLAIAGAEDIPTPVASLAAIAEGVADGRLVVLDDAAHLPPAEAPAAVAQLIRAHLAG